MGNIGELLERKAQLVRNALSHCGSQTVQAAEHLLAGERLNEDDGRALFAEPNLALLATMASWVRIRKNGLQAYYNRNGHVEPTNRCIFRCAFCSFRKEHGQDGVWTLTLDEILQRAKALQDEGCTEIHITGGVHPDWTLSDLEHVVKSVREVAPRLHVKAFSAIELLPFFTQAGVSIFAGLGRLQQAGLGSLPGGGAEIFAEDVRQRICPEKGSADDWLSIHRAAHKLGLCSNATMLFGHVESLADRVDHLLRLRALQDETGGFNCFIPLKFRAAGNALGLRGEVTMAEVLRTFAVSRILLDNIQHLKAYWPMLGKAHIPLALAFGADDLDGTIGNSTKIYSMAGAEEQKPSATVEELEQIVRDAGFIPVERDSLYHPLS